MFNRLLYRHSVRNETGLTFLSQGFILRFIIFSEVLQGKDYGYDEIFIQKDSYNLVV